MEIIFRCVVWPPPQVRVRLVVLVVILLVMTWLCSYDLAVTVTLAFGAGGAIYPAAADRGLALLVTRDGRDAG